MKIIDLENHFFTKDYIRYLRSRKVPPRETEQEDGLTMWYNDVLCSPRGFEMEDKLLDLGEESRPRFSRLVWDRWGRSSCMPP